MRVRGIGGAAAGAAFTTLEQLRSAVGDSPGLFLLEFVDGFRCSLLHAGIQPTCSSYTFSTVHHAITRTPHTYICQRLYMYTVYCIHIQNMI